MSPEDKKTINSVLEEATKWLDNNQHGTKEEYEEKQKELESKILPLLQKGMDPNAMGGGMDGMPDMSGMALNGMPKPSTESHDSGPKIEEID